MGFSGEARGKETTWKTGGDGRPILKRDVKQVRWGGMDWIDLAQDRDRWRAVVDAAMNLRIP